MKRQKLILCILDGWGYAPPGPSNAISQAHTPTWDRWLQTYPLATLEASGPAVGLPAGQMGNSEVGHMTIGAGRAVLQDLPRADHAFQTGSFQKDPFFLSVITRLKETGRPCHLLGLLSDGGVHAHLSHILEMARLMAQAQVHVCVHALLDGRDTLPKSATTYLRSLQEVQQEFPSKISLATFMGRYYAMDRDQRWERTEKAYDALVSGIGPSFSDPFRAVEDCYEKGIADEFMPPFVHASYKGAQAGDGLFFLNFRADRMRQLCEALVDPAFKGFSRKRVVPFFQPASLTSYHQSLDPLVHALLPPHQPESTLGEVLSRHHLTQMRLAETEKYAHITFFLNGGREQPFPGEKRFLVPSPKVATYDLCPAMSAQDLTEGTLKAIQEGYDVIILNFANADMVGHSGHLPPTISAIEFLDKCLHRIESQALEKGYVLAVTADHGNAEEMIDSHSGGPLTAHTLNKVPFLLVNNRDYKLKPTTGSLQDIAPTLLTVLSLPIPQEYTGRSLIQAPDTKSKVSS